MPDRILPVGGYVPLSFAGAIPFAPVTSLLVPDDYKRTELAWRLSTKEDNPVLLLLYTHSESFLFRQPLLEDINRMRFYLHLLPV